MTIPSDSNLLVFCIVLLVVIGFLVQRIENRGREAKLKFDRLSLTFLKIENDLAAIQNCIIMLSRAHNRDVQIEVLRMRNAAPHILRSIIEDGPNAAQILRGLEFPSPDDDPVFWAKDRIGRFGLADVNDNNAAT